MIGAAKQTRTDAELLASVEHEFPLSSQTSVYDKLFLLKIRDFLQSRPSYNYVEIGSYLGGSLVPFCRDQHCAHILSIDDRGRNQPDERGATYDYTSVTSRMMLDNLKEQGIPEGRVEVFDGSVSDYTAQDRKYDLMMVDGEHTNWACFRDFIHGEKLLADNAIVMFHDSILIFEALKTIQEYLKAKGKEFIFFKEYRSDISVILLNDYCRSGLEGLFELEPDLELYQQRAREYLATQFVHNNTMLSLKMTKLVMRKQPRSFKQA